MLLESYCTGVIVLYHATMAIFVSWLIRSKFSFLRHASSNEFVLRWAICQIISISCYFSSWTTSSTFFFTFFYRLIFFINNLNIEYDILREWIVKFNIYLTNFTSINSVIFFLFMMILAIHSFFNFFAI